MRGHAFLFSASFLVFACGGDESSTTSSTGTGASGAAGGGGSGAAGGTGGTGGTGSGRGGGGGAVAQNQFLYVANRDSSEVLIYAIEDDGSLTDAGSVAVPDAGPLAVDPSREHLYVASVVPDSVTAFSIDHATGGLTPLGGAVSVGITPVYVAVDPTDSWLVVASYGDNQVQTHAISGDGTVSGVTASEESPGTNPHAVLVHPSGQWAFVPVTNENPNSLVAQYGFDVGTGQLSPNGAANAGAGVGPRHLVLHPTMDLLYVVNEHDDSVTTWDLDTATGTLTALDTVTTIPGGANAGANTCADIHVTPSGQFLYASNRGDDSIAMFALDGSTGLPTPLGHEPTEAVPREFEVTRDGRYLYAAGESSDAMASYRIEADGTLTPLTVQPVGDRPSWVLAISVDAE
ncbi:MAG TPA: lactonase family protein [Polyangiaceae bacterium]|nr:lactonase family protein [Polyangiaceae bacterium]